MPKMKTVNVSALFTIKSTIENDYDCHVCLELAIETCSCNNCGAIILCKPCMLKLQSNVKSECPICRQPATNLGVNMALKRIVSNLTITCSLGCGVKHTVAETPSHKKACPNRETKCNSCQVTTKHRDFAKHCFECHEDMIRNIFDESKHASLDKVWETATRDQIMSIVNLNDVDATLGTTGKYYCGQNVDGCKVCCDGRCGPSNGCNCRACMIVDVTQRMLKPGFLVNGEGRNCRVSKANGLV